MKERKTFREILKSIRKPIAPPSHVMKSKKAYNRKDKSWKNED